MEARSLVRGNRARRGMPSSVGLRSAQCQPSRERLSGPSQSTPLRGSARDDYTTDLSMVERIGQVRRALRSDFTRAHEALANTNKNYYQISTIDNDYQIESRLF